MGRDPEDYLAGAGEEPADMTADSSLLGWLQLTGDTHTMAPARLTESERPKKAPRNEDA